MLYNVIWKSKYEEPRIFKRVNKPKAEELFKEGKSYRYIVEVHEIDPEVTDNTINVYRGTSLAEI